jgi:hypothetical protein
MPDLRKRSLNASASSIDRRAAFKIYVPPTLATIGLIARTTHNVSGSGGPHPDSSRNGGDSGNVGGQGGGGGKTAPRNHAALAREDGHGRKPH